MECTNCGRDFPKELIAPMNSSEGHHVRLCPICALKLRNVIHDLPKLTPFEGPKAHQMFLAAVRYLGHRAPKWAKKVAKRSKAEGGDDGV